MSSHPRPQPGILDIAPYVPGRSAAPEGVKPVKLSSNESPLGASPLALAAFREAADRLEIYPEGSSNILRQALGEMHGINPGQIVCGNGSDDLLHLLAQAYLGPGQDAVMSQYGFSVYPIVAQAAGAGILKAPEHDYTADVDALLVAVTDQTRVMFLANPNNPTGTYLGAAELRRLHAGLRPDILLVLDSAYAEYVTADDYEAGFRLVEQAQNVVMVRTFSKIGLAALRLGWMYGPSHVVDALNRIRGPFNVNGPAQRAGAEAARDQTFNRRLADHNAHWRTWLTARLSSNRIRLVPSQANFVLALFESEARASEAFTALMSQGLIVRELGVYGIPQGLRISIGTEKAMRAVADILAAFGAAGEAG